MSDSREIAESLDECIPAEGEMVKLLLRPVAGDHPLRVVLEEEIAGRLKAGAAVQPRAGEDTVEMALGRLRMAGRCRRGLTWLAVAAAVLTLAAIGMMIYDMIPPVAVWFSDKGSLPDPLASWTPALRVLGWRAGLTLSAALCLAAAGFPGLRMLSRRGTSREMVRCLSQLLNPWRCVPAGVNGVMAGAGLSAGCLALMNLNYYSDLTAFVTPLLGGLLALAASLRTARREVRRRTAFLGLQPAGRFNGGLGWLAVISLVIAILWIAAGILLRRMGLSPDRYLMGYSLPGDLARWAGIPCGVLLAWLGIKVLLGYGEASRSLRHRLIALQLMPALLAAAVAFAGLALLSQPVERVLVRKAWKEMAERRW